MSNPTETLTLVGFLEQRISEDEVAVERAIDAELAPSGWLGPLRAALESQRLIVDAARDYSPELEHGDNGEWAFNVALKALATTHAHHPDFRPEWAS